MAYEVDNRYPEVAAPYEKVRGVKRHGGVSLGRASQFGALKAVLMTLAAALVITAAVLPEKKEPENEPVPVEQPFTAPTIAIRSAELTADTVTPLIYTYCVELNSAETLRVNAAVTDETGREVGADGPYEHRESGTSPPLRTSLNWTERPETLTLTLTASYEEKNETKTLTASRTLPVPELPFLAPTLAIRSAELTADTVTPLLYSYQVALNSAETMQVKAVITDENGFELGTDGPYDHGADETSPTRSAALAWTEYPETVTLTLTGTYLEKGETKTLTASQTLPVPEQPFTAPLLTIESAELTADTVTPLLYTYRVELNSAESLQVSAVITDENGNEAGTDGPFDHGTDGLSPAHSADLTWTEYPVTLTLTLTGTYEEKGETKTLTASQTLPVPEEPFTAPTLAIRSAALTAGTVTPLVYTYQIELNSAGSLRVDAVLTDENGNELGTDGPYDHSADETSPSRSAAFTWTNYPVSVTLTLIGTYEEKGETKTLTASQTLTVPERPFTAPTLAIASAELTADTVTPLVYTYQIELNSAENLRVTAVVTDEDGTRLGTDGPYDHGTGGTSPPRRAALSWTEYPQTLTLTLTGTYAEKGETKTLTASRTLSVPQPEEPFTAPALSIAYAQLTADTVTPLTYTYQVVMNSAEDLLVNAVITDENGARLGTDGPYDHTADGTSPVRRAAFSWTDRPASVTLTLTGTYREKDETKTLTASQTLTVPELPFTAPSLSIASAELTADTVTPFVYTYQIELNSAESLQVSAVLTDENGAQLGTDGPYDHTADGTSPSRSAAFSWTDRPAEVTLTLTGTYSEKGETKTLTASRTLSVPELPFTAPSLSIASAELTADTVTPLVYTYTIELNSAESLQVSAVLTDENGAQLGTDGPYDHTADGTSPSRSAAFSWTERPAEVTLTLTGTYTEKGETKTLTASRTLSVPEEPFLAPTLSIASAELTADTLVPLIYTYTIELNSAESLQVSASVTDRNGVELGTDGPYSHTASGTSPERSAVFDWAEYPETLTLTLTGTYAEKGETKTLTASQTLPVPEQPFIAPTLAIASAELTADDITPLLYTYEMEMNSAESLQVSAVLTDENGNELGTDGPYSHTAGGTSPARSIAFEWDEYPATVTLTLTGTYTEKGETKTLTASQTLSVPEPPFIAPLLGIATAEFTADTVTPLDYTYKIELNSAESLRVTAVLTDQDGNELGTDGPYDHTADGTSPERSLPFSWAEYPETLTLTLTGTYTEKGETKTLTDVRTLPMPEEPFKDPEFTEVKAFVDDFEEWGDVILNFAYHLDVGDASSVTVKAVVKTDQGLTAGEEDDVVFTASDYHDAELNLLLTEEEKTVTLTLTGTYEDDEGAEKTITADATVILSMAPDWTGAGGEMMFAADGEHAYVEFWAEFDPRPWDPHANDYEFEAVSFTVYWYDDSGSLLGSGEAAPPEAVECTREDNNYIFRYNGELSTTVPENTATATITLMIFDTSTEKLYALQTYELEIN